MEWITKSSYRPSRKTKPVAFRLTNEVIEILERRVAKGRWEKLSDYIRDRITTDALRKR